jgi:hypothetical protein
MLKNIEKNCFTSNQPIQLSKGRTMQNTLKIERLKEGTTVIIFGDEDGGDAALYVREVGEGAVTLSAKWPDFYKASLRPKKDGEIVEIESNEATICIGFGGLLLIFGFVSIALIHAIDNNYVISLRFADHLGVDVTTVETEGKLNTSHWSCNALASRREMPKSESKLGVVKI